MNPFYNSFEKNVSGLSTDVVKTIRGQIEDLMGLFPRLRDENINVELECRYKSFSMDKLVGPLLTDLDSNPGMKQIVSQIEDDNHSVKHSGYNMTLRRTVVDNSPETFYIKIPVMFRRNTPASSVLESFENMGIKLAFSLEITADAVYRELLSKYINPGTEPLKRIKNRTSYVDSYGYSTDITRVASKTNVTKMDLEVEVDYTIPLTRFNVSDPIGVVKNFISVCEERSRTLVFRSRTLVPKFILEEAILTINRALGVENPREWRIEKQIPQVRNIQVTDLLKDMYRGYGATPKADGYRYFMVILEYTIILVRPASIYKVLYEGRDIPKSWVGFVFDGELIDKENWREENIQDRIFLEGVDNYYCIFDVLGYPPGGSFTATIKNDILQRVNCLKGYFEEVRRSPQGIFRWSNKFNSIYFQPTPVTRVKTPIMKTFFEIKPYDDATGNIWDASDQFFTTLQPKLRYKDDGIIFTPVNIPYQELSDPKNMTMKWKPSELLSIDFRYKNGDIYAWLSDTKASVIDEGQETSEVPFRGSPLFPITRDQIRITNPDNVRLIEGQIYEFIYNTNLNTFRVTRPRFDKSMPNTIKDSIQIWNDYNRPVSTNLIRGIGNDGLIECRREALWTWFVNVISKVDVVFDASDLNPSVEFPLRFLEDGTFKTAFRNTVVYRSHMPYNFDFPKAAKVSEIGKVDILILTGQQVQMLEGRENVYIGDSKSLPRDYIVYLQNLVRSSSRIFVRNFVSIIPAMLPTTFHPDRSAYGNEEEMVVTRLDDETVDIHFKLGGVFYDITSGGYSGCLHCLAHTRNININDKDTKIVSAGHRITPNIEDMGPELVLGGKHFGKLWDYTFNAMLPASYFENYLQPLLTRVGDDTDPLEDLIKGIQEVSIEAPRSEMIKEVREFNFNVEFETIKYDLPENTQLTREDVNNPEYGDIFDIIAKAVHLVETEIPPLGRTTYDYKLCTERASELRLLFKGLLNNDNPEELVRTVYERLGLGIVFLRRILSSGLVTSYRSAFIRPDLYNNPTYGFILVESRPEELSLTKRCCLLKYANKIIIHRSDPLLLQLYQRPLETLNLTAEKSKLSPSNSGVVKVGSTSWKTLHRLFGTMRFVYPGAPEINKEYIQKIISETTDNKAYYLINMELPDRFKNQKWGIEILATISEFTRKGVKPDPTFEYRAESEFSKLLESFTEKSRRELLATGDRFLYDDSYPFNLYGKGLMNFRNKLKQL